VVVVGSGPAPSGAEVGRPDVPLSQAIGEWLLGGRAQAEVVDPGAPAAACAQLGREIAASPDRVALLVMGDGSACRGEKSPGYDDPRAEGFDRTVGEALARADAAALLAVDPELARELRCAGRAPWQVLAGTLDHGAWRAEVSYDKAPYGVAYFVAVMSPMP
jgi:aromatic ring-opening dioxygenase LigB subunit